MFYNFSQSDSLINEFVAQLRDVQIQKDRPRFRKNVERIGEIMAYELSKLLPYETRSVQTPLGVHQSRVPASQPVVATILRAGLTMQRGFLNYFDEADSAYISAYRKHTGTNEFEIVVEYMASPPLQGRTLVLIDPMLATGRSMHLCYQALCRNGKPEKLYLVSLIASQKGIEYVQSKMPDATIFTAALDPELNDQSYIVPGLGDAGDLSFGEKL